jgi:hypothetical protein
MEVYCLGGRRTDSLLNVLQSCGIVLEKEYGQIKEDYYELLINWRNVVDGVIK